MPQEEKAMREMTHNERDLNGWIVADDDRTIFLNRLSSLLEETDTDCFLMGPTAGPCRPC